MDDDIGNIGAGGASQLQLTVAGTGGLKNTNQWTPQAPLGPVKSTCCSRGRASAGLTDGDTLYRKIKVVSNDHTDQDHHGGSNTNLSNGDKVVIDQVKGNTAANGTFKIDNVTRNTFELFDRQQWHDAGPPHRGRYS